MDCRLNLLLYSIQYREKSFYILQFLSKGPCRKPEHVIWGKGIVSPIATVIYEKFVFYGHYTLDELNKHFFYYYINSFVRKYSCRKQEL
jgi:hypothetical protein